MFGCLSCAAVCASRRKRLRTSALNASSGGSTLIATRAVQPQIGRAIDDGHAAAADLTRR